MSQPPGPSAEMASATLAGDLQSWEESFRIAIDTIPGLAWFGSADGPVEFLNKQWCDYTGMSMGDALGWGWTTTIHPDDVPGLQTRWQDALAQGAPGELEARVRRFDGEYRWFLFRYAPLRNSAGQVVKWYGSNTDIESRKHTEDALRASEQLIRGQVNALKSSLDALANESEPRHLVTHTLTTLTAQFGAHSASVWRRGFVDTTMVLDFVFENGSIVSSTAPRFAGFDLTVSTEDIWTWSEVSRSRRVGILEDIRIVPPFPLRDRLLPLGIVTILFLPLIVAGRLEGAIALRFQSKRAFQPEQIELAQAFVNQTMLMIRLAELSEQGREAAVAQERNRIARDIHDTLAQGLTGIIIQLEAAEDAGRRNLLPAAEQHVATARNLARESLSEARRSVQALRPQTLEDSGITHALRALFSKSTAGMSLSSDFQVLGEPRILPSDWEDNLFRIAQECLTNVLRHAQASSVHAAIRFEASELLLQFIDNGRGFDPAARSEGYGLLGMRERVCAMGGEMNVESSVGRGTIVSVCLPLTAVSALELN